MLGVHGVLCLKPVVDSGISYARLGTTLYMFAAFVFVSVHDVFELICVMQ